MAHLILAEPLEAPSLPPVVAAPRPGPLSWDVIVQTRDGTRLGALRSAVPVRCVEVLSGVGEHVFTWSPRPGEEPSADRLIGDGRLLTWVDDDLEVGIYRQGALVAVGPVVSHRWDPSGRITTTCWSREAYPAALVVGGADRLNLFDEGDWDNGYSWSIEANISASLSSDLPWWRTDRVLELEALDEGAAYVRETLHFPPTAFLNVVHWSIPVSGGYGDDPAAMVRHFTQSGGGDPVLRRTEQLVVDAGASGWSKLEVALREEPEVNNIYEVTLYAPPDGDRGRVGEVQCSRSENVSARAGWDEATLIAALFDDALDRLPGWERHVIPTGNLLVSNVRYDKADHPDAISVLRDWEHLGDWWVPLGTRMLRWAPHRGSTEPVMSLTRDTASGLTLLVDGSESATEMVVLSDGQSGPTREEGGADDGSGLRLMRVERAPLGMAPYQLDQQAETLIDVYRPAARSVEAVADVGPVVLPGDWWHRTECGDRVRVRVVDGLMDEPVECRIGGRTLDCASDQVTPRLVAV